VAGALREFDDLVLDRRTIPGPYPLDLAAIKGGLVEIAADHGVRISVRVSQMTENLVLELAPGPVGKRDRILVARLGDESLPIDRLPVQAHGRSGLQPDDPQVKALELLSQLDRRRFVGSPGRVALKTDMDHPVEECPRGQNNGPGREDSPLQRPDPLDRALGDDHLRNDALKERQVGQALERMFHLQPVGRLVALGPGCLDRPAPAPVEETELDARPVGENPHQAPKGVDLPDKLSLGQSADSRIAGHLGDRVEMGRHQAYVKPHPARRGRRLATGVPGADDDDIEGIRHHWALLSDTEPAEDLVQDLPGPDLAREFP